MAAPTCLSVRAACEAITKKTSKTMKYHAKVDPYGAHCADFAGLITLGLADPKCNVGVRIPSSDLPRVIAELTGVGSKTTPSKGAARHVGYPEGDDQGQTAPPPTIIGLGRGKARLQLAQVMDALTQDRDARQVVRLDDEAIARGIPDQPDD
jgi:hypothetical protein